jgi:hypothetical protein
MEELLKEKIPGLYKLISIEKSNSEKDKHIVYYIDLSHRHDKSPTFALKFKALDLKVEMREHLIFNLLNSKVEDNSISVNEDLYTPEQRDKIKSLRNKNISNRSNIMMAKIEWSNQFNVGDRVYYKGEHGVISFKHNMKSNNKPQEWSVICNNTEYRYVTGALLTKREVSDLSSIKVDKDLDKLDTVRLLKMYRRSLKDGRGKGDVRIKRILNERENLSKVEKVITVR